MNRKLEVLKTELNQLGEDLFNHPELGYKEFKTRSILIEFFKKHQVDVHKEFAHTGFSVQFGSGYPHIGLIAELDAVITPHHRCAINDDHAAHSCGHSSQCVLMAGAFLALKEEIKQGTITLFFTPAEEYLDIEYRKTLKAEGKIKAFGGKQEMLLNREFDEIDLFIHAHGMGEAKERYSIHSSLAGFNYQVFKFKGISAHAAVAPHEGKNALNMFQLYQVALAFLRESFIDEDKNRIHGHIIAANNSVNTVADEVIYEQYIRSFNPDTLEKLTQQCIDTAQHCAQALGGNCEVETSLGYLPMKASIELGQLFDEEITKVCDRSLIRYHERSIAAGDIGDLSQFIPGVQIGYSGFLGRMHGDNLEIQDTELIYQELPEMIVKVVKRLVEDDELVKNIVNKFEKNLDLEAYKLRFSE